MSDFVFTHTIPFSGGTCAWVGLDLADSVALAALGLEDLGPDLDVEPGMVSTRASRGHHLGRYCPEERVLGFQRHRCRQGEAHEGPHRCWCGRWLGLRLHAGR